MTVDMTPYEGKHGTLVIGESTLVGTVAEVYESGSFNFMLDVVDSWLCGLPWRAVDSFTPDPDPLPTVPGIYLDAEEDIWSRSNNGEWALLAYKGGTRVPDSDCLRFYPAMYTPLIRLVKERAK